MASAVGLQNADLVLLEILRQPMGQWVPVPRRQRARLSRLVALGLAEASSKRLAGRDRNTVRTGRVTHTGRDLLLGWLDRNAITPTAGAVRFGLSERQRFGYEVIRRSIARTGIAPSVREIQAAMGLTSTSAVIRMLDDLEARGWIQREPRKSRSIRLVDENAGRPMPRMAS